MGHTILQNVVDPVPTVLTVGFFDGVHLGHRALIERVTEAAREKDVRSAVFTFDPHPKAVLTGARIDLLTSLTERTSLLSATGIDSVVVVPFDRPFSEMSADRFVRDILIDRMGLVHMVAGYDHSLGRGGAGNARTITELGRNYGFTVDVVEQQIGSHGAFSSSAIRESISRDGDVAKAATQLGRAYGLRGTVVHGDGRGRQLGFPTANLEVTEPTKIVPLNGVYAVHVLRESTGTVYDGIMNIGVRPTLTKGLSRVLEAHLLAFDDDLYGEILTITFIDRIRREKKFDGVDELIAQIDKDIMDCIRLHETLSLED